MACKLIELVYYHNEIWGRAMAPWPPGSATYVVGDPYVVAVLHSRLSLRIPDCSSPDHTLYASLRRGCVWGRSCISLVPRPRPSCYASNGRGLGTRL